jgi:signal transduction histidine kinase
MTRSAAVTLVSTSSTPAVEESHEIDRLRSENQTLRRQLQHAQRLASVGTMASMVVHEFNNLLTPIVNYAQLARKNPVLTEKALDRAITGGRRAASICEAILGMARTTAEPNVPFNLAEMVSETLLAMARDPQKDNIQFLCNIPEDMDLCVRRVELQQVLLNLLLNARAAVLQQGGVRRIVLSCEKTSDYILLDVTDNGSGISEENRTKIFDPFFTTKTDPNGQSRGSGLGLAICRDILHAMGGELTVESKVDIGTAFTIRLPR